MLLQKLGVCGIILILIYFIYRKKAKQEKLVDFGLPISSFFFYLKYDIDTGSPVTCSSKYIYQRKHEVAIQNSVS
jgi:hypothetical protein